MARELAPAVRLRAASPDDCAVIAAIYRPFVEESYISFEMAAPDASEIRQRMNAAGTVYPWVVADEGGEVLGYAYASAFRTRPAYRFAVETTVYVRRGSEGRGLGRALYEPLIAVLEAQGFTQAIGAISLPNAASVGLHERVGFKHAGTYRDVGFKNGRWHDVGFWQRSLAATAPAPAEPKRLTDLAVERFYDR